MITYPASLDVPEATLETVTRWLTAHRRRPGARPVQRAATARTQALLVLRWFKDVTKLRILALDAGISIATAYRYLHEAIDVIAQKAPTLGQPLERATAQDLALPLPGRHADPHHEDRRCRGQGRGPVGPVL